MWTKATIGGVAAAAILAGSAGAAIAHAQGASTTATPAASSTGTATGAAAGKAKSGTKHDGVGKEVLGNLKDFQHGEWVTKDAATNTDVTHDAILGQVSAVSSTSVTVKAADGTSLTFAVNDQTKVRQPKAKAANGSTPSASPSSASIGAITQGQTVLVAGVKSPDLTAKTVVARAS